MRNHCSIVVILILTALIAACGGGDNPANNPPSRLVILYWDAPDTREDGSTLMPGDLAGYRIYTSTTGATFTRLADIGEAATARHTITDLPAGTYYYYITAYDTDGVESKLSNIVYKTIE